MVGSGEKWTSAGGVVVDARGRIALVRERGRAGWALPKGRIEPGENLEDAALREVREETGVKARVTRYVGVHEGKRNFVHYFLMKVLRIEGKPDAAEIDAVRFVSPSQAAELLRSRRDRQVLAAIGWSADRRARLAGSR